MTRGEARRRALWGLLFLAGLVVPVLAAAVTFYEGRGLRLAATLGALVAVDAPLVRAGVAGAGPVGMVQPWRWQAYAAWAALRLLIVVPMALVDPAR